MGPLEKPPVSADQERPPRTQLWVMGAVLVWGIILALGATMFRGRFGYWDILRGVIVLSCVLLFLGFWNLMLLVRQRRMR